MPTGAAYANITNKRVMGQRDFKDNFLDYCRALTQELHKRVFTTDGVFDTKLTIAADGASRIRINGTSKATDALGNIIDPANSHISALLTGVHFENANAAVYHVGLRHQERPEGIQVNPRTGLPMYLRYREIVGEKANPDSVIDNGSSITFNINSVCESGVSHAGRQCLVYLKTPAKGATSEAIAFEVRTVVYSAPDNTITASGKLGQVTISTSPTDYEVVLLGPSVKRSTDLRDSANHVFLGTVTGNGGTPVAFSNAGQNLIDFSVAQLNDVLRKDSHGRMKIEVKADSSDAGEPQITVVDSGGIIRFSIDEGGNLLAYGGSMLGNQTSDVHIVTGTLAVGIGPSLKVNGADGRVGIGGEPHATLQLRVVGGMESAGHITPQASNVSDLGSPSLRWSTVYFQNLNVAGDFLPATNEAQDMGSTALRWAEGWFGFRVWLESLTAPEVTIKNTSGAANEKGWRWKNLGNDFRLLTLTDANAESNVAISFRRTGTTVNLVSFGASITPDTNEVQDIGNATLRWGGGYFGSRLWMESTAAPEITVKNTSGAANEKGWRWQNLGNGFRLISLTDANADSDVAISFQRTGTTVNLISVGASIHPDANNSKSLGSASLRWNDIHYGGLLHCQGSSSDQVVQKFRTGGSVPNDEKVWAWETATSELWFTVRNDADVSSVPFLKFTRSGAAPSSLRVNADLVPEASVTHNFGSAALRWGEGHFGYLMRMESDAVSNFIMRYNSAAANERGWALQNFGGTAFRLLTLADNDSGADIAISFTRSGSTVSQINAGAGINPDTDNSFDLGSSAMCWRDAHVGRELKWRGAAYQFTHISNTTVLTTAATTELNFDFENLASAFSGVFHPGGDNSRFEVSRSGLYRISFRISPRANATITAGTYREITAILFDVTTNSGDVRGLARTSNSGGNIDANEYFPPINHTFIAPLVAGNQYCLRCHINDATQTVYATDLMISFEELPHD